MTTMDLSALLNGSGVKSASFPTIGTSVVGTIVSTEVRQARDFDSGEPKTWDNGDPQMQIVITLATDQRDPADPEDNGHRRVFFKTWGQHMQALREGLRQAGEKEYRDGGTLSVLYSGDGDKPKPHLNPPKQFTVTYRPPAATSALNNLVAGGNGAATPTQPPAAQPASTGVDYTALVNALRGVGQNDEQIRAALISQGASPQLAAATVNATAGPPF